MTRPVAVLLGLLLVVAAPLGVSVATNALAEALGRNLGKELASALAALPPAPKPSSPRDTLDAPVISPALPALEESASPGREAKESASPKAARGPRSKAPPNPLGVRVRSQQVLALAEQRALPGARPVPAQGARPAGLELHGVDGLGVGMHDGDILTSVAGARVTSVASVAEQVLSARAQRAPEIAAQFWRNGAPGLLVVEQPYAPLPNPQ